MIMLISGDLLINNSILSAAFNSVCEREREREREREKERGRERRPSRESVEGYLDMDQNYGNEQF